MFKLILAMLFVGFLTACDGDNGGTNPCPPKEQFPNTGCDINGKPGDGAHK